MGGGQEAGERSTGTTRLEVMALSAIVLLGFVFRILVYTRHPYSYGIDGPYYNLQVRSILRTGWPYMVDTPFALYFFTLCSLLIGDITLGIKVGVSLLSSLIAVPVFILVGRATGDRRAGLFASFLSLFDPLHMQLLNNFLKNTAGILFLLCFLCLFLRCCEEPRLGNYATASALLLLTFVTHIYPAGLSALFVGGFILILWLANRRAPTREIRVSAILFASLLVGTAIILVAVPGSLTKFSKVLSLLSSFEDGTIGDLSIFGMGQAVRLLSIPLVLGLAYLIWDLRGGYQGREGSLFLSIFAASLLLSLPIVPRQWRGRFELINFVPVALLSGYGLHRAERDLPRIVVYGLIVITLFSSSYDTMLSARRMGPIIDERGIEELEALRGMIPGDSIMVVHSRVFYWVELVTGLRTFHGMQDPIQLGEEYGCPVYGLMERGEPPPPPNALRHIILEDGPYIIFRIYPRQGP